jgi:hypothetical protein
MQSIRDIYSRLHRSLIILMISMISLVALSSASQAASIFSNWKIGTVDDSGYVGQGNSIALAPDGFSHISYYDNSHYAVKHAYEDGSGWHVEDIQAQKDSHSYFGRSSIAIDAFGFVHVSYFNPNPVALMYAERDALGWTVITVTLASDASTFSSLALDTNGSPQIAFCDGSLHYAYLVGDLWQVETIDDACASGSQRSLALGTDGTPHVGYQKAEALWYAFKDTGGWHPQMLAGGGFGITTGSGASIALDSLGYAHIAHNFYSSTDFGLLYEYQDAQGWHRETIDDQLLTNNTTSIVIDNQDDPHVSYFYAWPNEGLAYAHRLNGVWQIELVEAGGTTYTSLAIKDGLFPYISYAFSADGQILKVAYLPASFSTFVPIAVK